MPITPTFSELSVLLVEPSQMQAALVTQLLNALGVRLVNHVKTGDDALVALAQGRTGVVMSALYLPDMQGTDLVMEMRRVTDLESVPFILISSETRPAVLDPIRQSGACCILAKPFNAEQLARALGATIDYLAFDGQLNVDIDLDNLTVLLVDDSKAARRHLVRLLADMGIEHVLEAENGVQAVQLMSDHMVDLVITDYNMPEMDGRALTEFIRTQSWQNSVPILMVTSEEDYGRLAAVEQAGVSAICDKPLDPTTLMRLIEQTMAQA